MYTRESPHRINSHFLPDNSPWKKKRQTFNSSKQKVEELRTSLANMERMIMRSRQVLVSSKEKLKIQSKSKKKLAPSDKLNIKLNTNIKQFQTHNKTISNMSNIFSIQNTPKAYKDHKQKEFRNLNNSTELPKAQNSSVLFKQYRKRLQSIEKEQQNQRKQQNQRGYWIQRRYYQKQPFRATSKQSSVQSNNTQQLNQNNKVKRKLFNIKEKQRQQIRLKQKNNNQIFIDDDDYFSSRVQQNTSYKIPSEKHNYPDSQVSYQSELTYYQQHQLKKQMQKNKSKIQHSQNSIFCCYCGEELPSCYQQNIKPKQRSNNLPSQFQEKSFLSPKNQSTFFSYKDQKNVYTPSNKFSSPRYSNIQINNRQDQPEKIDYGRIQQKSPLNRKSTLIDTTYSFKQKAHERSSDRNRRCQQCQHCAKHQTQNQRERFVKKVKKYGFVERYLTTKQIYGIFQKLKNSEIPQHRWPLVVIDEVYERMQKQQKYKLPM